MHSAMRHRKGVLLFLVAFSFFFIATGVLGMRYNHHVEERNRSIPLSQKFDTASLSKVHIRGEESIAIDHRDGLLTIRHNNTLRQMQVKLDSRNAKIDVKQNNGVLEIFLNSTTGRRYMGNIEIELPQAMSDITLEKLPNTRIMGDGSSTPPLLYVTTTDCPSHFRVEFNEITVEQLHLERVCKVPSREEKVYSVNADFYIASTTHIKNLFVTMNEGIFTVENNAAVDKAKLTLGDRVTVSAPSKILKIAQLGTIQK